MASPATSAGAAGRGDATGQVNGFPIQRRDPAASLQSGGERPPPMIHDEAYIPARLGA